MKIEMKKRIEQELQNTVPQKITKLEFAGDCRAQQLEGLTDEFENLRDLTLTNVGLTTLKGFPKLNNLKRLTLQDNCLNGGLENLAQCINLTHLDLKGNKIQCIEQLEPLACLKSLRVLELENCEIAKTERYREKIFALLPSVKYIDGLDARGEEDEGEEFENEEADGDEENDGSFDGDENDDDDDEDDDEDGSEDDDASDDANEKSKKRSVIRSRPSDLIKLFSTLSIKEPEICQSTPLFTTDHLASTDQSNSILASTDQAATKNIFYIFYKIYFFCSKLKESVIGSPRLLVKPNEILNIDFIKYDTSSVINFSAGNRLANSSFFRRKSFNLNASLMRPLNYKRHTGKLKPFQLHIYIEQTAQMKTAPSNLNEKRKEVRKEERKKLRQKATDENRLNM